MTGFAALPTQADDERGVQWKGRSGVLGPPWAKMPLLTICMLGLQIVWSVEMGYASPYLLSLGLSKSFMSIVFVAGPLSGLIVQPLIGVLADRSKSRFGRRRPYMIGGALICVGAIVLLGFTRQFASIPIPRPGSANDALTIALAIWAIYCIDFSINAVQAADRALLVDILPTSQQEEGNAWAGRMFGLGSVAGFFVGNIDLPSWLPFFGNTQLEVLSILSSIILVACHLVTSFSVKEKVLVSTRKGKNGGGLLTALKDIWENSKKLPPTIRQICIIQFFAWMAWFPVLFFTTTYVGEIHTRSLPPDHPAADLPTGQLDEEAARLGSRALLFSSLLSFAASVAMPFFVTHEQTRSHTHKWSLKCHLAELWAFSHLIFALCMFSTFFTTSVWAATIMITITGFCWAITQWAPFSLLGEAIHSDSSQYEDDDDIQLSDRRRRHSNDLADGNNEEAVRLVSDERDDETEKARKRSPSVTEDDENKSPFDTPPAYLHHADDGTNGHDEEDGIGNAIGHKSGRSDNIGDKAGIILGIHNVFIVIPQFIVTALSSILFAIFEPERSVTDRHAAPVAVNGTVAELPSNSTLPMLFSRDDESASTDSPDTIGMIFRIGGASAAVAFVLAWRLSRELKRR